MVVSLSIHIKRWLMKEQLVYFLPLLPPDPLHHAKIAIHALLLPRLLHELPPSRADELIPQSIDGGGRSLVGNILLLSEAMADFL